MWQWDGRGLERGASSMATTGQCWPPHGAWGAGDTCPLPPPLCLLITPTQQPRHQQRRLKALVGAEPAESPEGHGAGACGGGARRLGAESGSWKSSTRSHSPKLTKPRIAFIDSFCTRRSDTDRNRRDGPQPQQRAHFFAHPPTRFSLGSGEDWSGGQAAWQQRGSAGLGMGHGARATPARSLPRSSY